VRSIERYWAQLVQRPIVLSPGEWSMLCDWHERGVPLSLVKEVMEERQARRSSRRKSGESGLRSLRYIAPAVEEAWGVVVQGRLADAHAEVRGAGEGVAGESEARSTARASEAWAHCRQRAPEDSALRDLLCELLDRLERGAVPEELDVELDSRLTSTVPEALRQVAEDDVDARLAPHRQRMDPSIFQETRRRAVVDRLRRSLGLPRLSTSAASDEVP
jgi:hypothetical protein